MICEMCKESIMEEAVESFGHLLEVRRRLLGLSQITTASRCGLDREYIKRVERDELVNITIPNMLRLSTGYGIDFQEMCELYAANNEEYERGFEIERHERYREIAEARKAQKDAAKQREQERHFKRTALDNGRGPRPDAIPPHLRENKDTAKEPGPE